MLKQLWALLAVAAGANRVAVRRLGLKIFGAVASDFLIMYCLLTAVVRRQAGLPVEFQETYFFFLGVGFFYWLSLNVNQALNRGLTDAARTSINQIIRRLPRLPLQEYEALGRGTLMTRILGDGNQVAGCRQALFGVLSGGLRLAIGGLFALSVSIEASAVAFLGLLLITTVASQQLTTLRKGFASVATDDAHMFELLRGQVEGGVAVKVHRARSRALGVAFDSVSERVRALRVPMFSDFYERKYAGDAIVYGLLGINVFVLPAVFGLGGAKVRELSMVTLWLVLGAVKLAMALPRLSSAAAALDRLREIETKLDDANIEPPPCKADLDGGPFADFRRICVEGLCFQYGSTGERAPFPIGPIDLEFRRGELVFVTGHNGSGKSTFARLLAGLYRPRAGRIVVDGSTVTDETLAAYRSLFTTIFVDHRLFQRTYELDAEAEARARPLLEELGIADKTSIVNGRITNSDLSTGQKKRLALVLARLSRKPILLLDEWAADQDPEFRAFFYERLLPQLRDEGRMVIVITHDASYFDRADRCLRFEHGQLRESAS